MGKIEELRGLKLQSADKEKAEKQRTVDVLLKVTEGLKIEQELGEVVKDLFGTGVIERGQVNLTAIDDKDSSEQYQAWYGRMTEEEKNRESTHFYGYNGYAVTAVARWPQFVHEQYETDVDGHLQSITPATTKTVTFKIGFVIGWDRTLHKIKAGIGYQDPDLSTRLSSLTYPLVMVSRLEIPENMGRFTVTAEHVATIKQGVLETCLEAENGFTYPLLGRIQRDREIIRRNLGY